MKAKILLFLWACLLHAGNMLAEGYPTIKSNKIEGLNNLNYPDIFAEKRFGDLKTVLACSLFGFDYEWRQDYYPTGKRCRCITYDFPDSAGTNFNICSFYDNCIFRKGNCVKEELITGKGADLVFLASPLSEEYMERAKRNGVDIACKPIAIDATIFLNHPKNPISDLTASQIQKIYTYEYYNWKQLGGTDIHIYNNVDIDSAYTGYFKEQFMEGKDINSKWLWGVYDDNPLCETKHVTFKGLNLDKDYGDIYYTQYLFRYLLYDNDWARVMKVGGVMPTKESILNGSYPYSMYVYAAVNTDREKHPMANKIYDYLTTEEGQRMLDDYGYIPLRENTGGIKSAPLEDAPRISYRDGWVRAEPSAHARLVSVTDLGGKHVASATLQPGADRAPLTLSPGLYLMRVITEGRKSVTLKLAI